MKSVLKSPAVRWSWLLLLLAAWVLWPALTQNIGAYAHDAAAEHIYRSVVFSEAISDGVLYPRWVQFLHWGLGSPLFTFQPPLPYYALDLLYRLGSAHPVGWRVLVAGSLLAAFLGMYLLVRTVTERRWPAIVAGVAYLYAPYVLRNTLVRGSTEAFGMVLYPWVLWGLIWVARRPSAGRFVLAPLLWAASIASHVLAPLMLAPVAALLALALAWRYRTVLPLLVLLAGGLLTAGIWAPMAFEQDYVHVERDFTAPEAIPSHNSIPIERLLAAPVIYDVARDNNSPGDRVGLLQTVLLLLGIPATIYAWIRGRRRIAVALGASMVTGLLLLWMLTSASDPVWGLPVIGGLLARLLYRTRLMGVQALAAAIVAGLMVALLPARWQRGVGVILAALFILAALPSLYVTLQHRYAPFESQVSLSDVRAAEIVTGGSALTAFGEFTPRWREAPFDEALLRELGPAHDPEAQPLVHPPSGTAVKSTQVRSNSWDLTVDLPESATLTLYLLYYPRWQATIDGQASILQPEPSTGYTQIDVPAGEHRVALRYARTPAEWAGLAVSGLVLLALLLTVAGALLSRSRHATAALAVQARAGTGAPEARGSDQDEVGESNYLPPVWLLSVASLLLLTKILYLDPGTAWFRCSSTATQVCDAQVTVEVPFVGGPRLRGYTVSSYTPRRGDVLRVNLFWQGEAGSGEKLSSFVHIRNSQAGWPTNPETGSEIWAQEDNFTPGGLLTRDFVPGKLYQDEIRVKLPETMPTGTYFLEIGLFDPNTGEQLDPQADSVQPPLRVLWRSILLPSVEVR
jgi:hypothetical protein